MSIRFQNQYLTFNKFQEIHEDVSNPAHSYIRFSCSSSRKRTDTGDREYSDWFAIARSKAVEIVKGLVKGDFVSCNGAVERVPYKVADGTKKWPDASLVIFEMTKYIKPEEDVVPSIEEKSDLPF